jgi:hypothetical protein
LTARKRSREIKNKASISLGHRRTHLQWE